MRLFKAGLTLTWAIVVDYHGRASLIRYSKSPARNVRACIRPGYLGTMSCKTSSHGRKCCLSVNEYYENQERKEVNIPCV